jgi:hypothetical protein
VPSTHASRARHRAASGMSDIDGQDDVRCALGPDTPRSVRVGAFGAEDQSTEAAAGTCVAALRGHSLNLAMLL